MADEDASSAEMRRSFVPDDDLPAVDDTVEWLLTGDLPPDQAPPGYAEVAALLAAVAAPPHPWELTGGAVVLAELRAVARARPPATTAPRPAARVRRRRRTGLAVVVVAGALAAGGVAGAATGHLPGPVREAAASILATGGGEPSASTGTGPRPAPATGTGGAGGAAGEGSRPGGATGGRLGPVGAGPAAGPDLEGLCQAFRSGAEPGGKLDAVSFRALARAAGGEEEVAALCEAIPPADDKPKEPSVSKEPGRPDLSGGGGNQGQQGSPGTSSPAPGR